MAVTSERTSSVDDTDVAIVGAGPYGLSLAAYLRQRGVSFRVFGRPMEFWFQIAQGGSNRYLKSFGLGTPIYVPQAGYSFVEYCLRRNLESFEPCSIEDFANYGIWVQDHHIPDVERVGVVDISSMEGGFHITLSNGDALSAKRVVVATGLTSYARIPRELSNLPGHLLSHSSQVSNFERFIGLDVCVVGAGQSALEAAVLLHEAGAHPRLLARSAKVAWNKQLPPKRTWWQRIRSPISGLGAGPKGFLLNRFPSALHHVPETWRVWFVARLLPPEGAWWLRKRFEQNVPVDLNCAVVKARAHAGRVALLIRGGMGEEREYICDHVIAGTGFSVDVDRLTFLNTDLRASVKRIQRAPRLNRNFESSAPGLFFVGPAAALSFGPLFRFVVGASFTARRLAGHLSSTSRSAG